MAGLDLEPGALCPACEVGKLLLKHSDLDYKYVTIKEQPSLHCPVCGESFVNKDIGQRIERVLAAARKEFS